MVQMFNSIGLNVESITFKTECQNSHLYFYPRKCTHDSFTQLSLLLA